MSRQADRRGEELSVRVSYLEADMDRVDERFIETAGRVDHAKGNLTVVLQGLERKLEQHTDKLESKVERIERETDAKIDALEKATSEEIGGTRKLLISLLVSTLVTTLTVIVGIAASRAGGG